MAWSRRIIAFPLLWESVTRFRLLTPNAAALGLALVTALTLAVALRQRLQVLAWIAVLAALATSLALVAATGVVLPFAGVTIALGIATLWIGYGADWVLLRWPAALVADLMVLALAARVSSGSWPDPPALVIALQLLLLTGHLASVAARTLVRGRDVNAFEVVQTAAALAVGFGGAVYVAQATGFATAALATMNLLVGAGCYGVAFAFLARQQELRRNFYFYTSLGLILVLVSMALLLAGQTVALAWIALGVLTTWLALRTDRVTLLSHAAVYVIAAASASGLLAAATAALVGPAEAPWPPMSPAALVVLAGAFACWAVPMSRRRRHVGRRPRPTAADHDGARVVSRRMVDRRHRAGAARRAGPCGGRRRHRDRADQRPRRGRARAGVGRTIRALPGVVVAALSGARGRRPEAARRRSAALAAGHAVHRAGAVWRGADCRAPPRPYHEFQIPNS